MICVAQSGLENVSTVAASDSMSEAQGGGSTVDYDMLSDMGTNTALKQFAMTDDDLYGKVSDLISGALVLILSMIVYLLLLPQCFPLQCIQI